MDPLTHLSIYKLSRKQTGSTLFVEKELRCAEQFKNQVDTFRALTLLKFETPSEFSEYIDATGFCERLHEMARIPYAYHHDSFHNDFYSRSRKGSIKKRISEVRLLIEKRSKELELEVACGFDYYISVLLSELQDLAGKLVKSQRRIYFQIKQKSSSTLSPDRRLLIQHRSYNFFKFLPDFSGSEEEAVFTIVYRKPIASFSKPRIKCITIQTLYLQRLIPLSNLRMTG